MPQTPPLSRKSSSSANTNSVHQGVETQNDSKAPQAEKKASPQMERRNSDSFDKAPPGNSLFPVPGAQPQIVANSGPVVGAGAPQAPAQLPDGVTKISEGSGYEPAGMNVKMGEGQAGYDIAGLNTKGIGPCFVACVFGKKTGDSSPLGNHAYMYHSPSNETEFLNHVQSQADKWKTEGIEVDRTVILGGRVDDRTFDRSALQGYDDLKVQGVVSPLAQSNDDKAGVEMQNGQIKIWTYPESEEVAGKSMISPSFLNQYGFQ